MFMCVFELQCVNADSWLNPICGGVVATFLGSTIKDDLQIMCVCTRTHNNLKEWGL